MRQKREAGSNVGLAGESGRRSGAVIESGYSRGGTFSPINDNLLIPYISDVRISDFLWSKNPENQMRKQVYFRAVFPP